MKTASSILTAVILTALTSRTVAQTTLTNAVIKYPWNNSLTAGLTLTRGNSDSLLASLKYLADKKTAVNEFSFDADGVYGSSSGKANNETLHGFGQWNHLFSERLYSYLRAEGLHDGIADIKYRGTFTAGAGYYFIKQTQTTLSGEVGPGVVTQRQADTDDTFATLRFAESFEHKFSSDNARIWQTVEILPQVDKWSNYLVNAEIGAEASVSKSISLSICLDDYYDSDPATARKRNDVKLVSGVTYKF